MSTKNEHIFGGGVELNNLSKDDKENQPKKPKRKGVIIAIAVVLLLYGLVANDSNGTNKNETPITTSEKNTEEALTEILNTETPKETEENTEVSTLELITMAEHPVLYDYLSKAHDFWDNYANGRIVFADDKHNYESGKTVLCIDAYLSTERNQEEHMIRKFEIYPDTEIAFEEGLNIAKSYLPMNILKQYYALAWSECYYDESQDRYTYIMLYTPTENGKEIIDDKKLDYVYAGVIIGVKDDIVTSISITSTNPISRNITNGTKKIDWEYDFLK